MGDKYKLESENRNEDPLTYAPSVSDWRFGGANLTNASIGLVPHGNAMPVSQGDLIGSSSSSSTSMVDSFGPTFWEHQTNAENLGFCDISVQKNASTSETIGSRKGFPASSRSGDKTFDIDWNPTTSMFKAGMFLSNAPAMLPQRLPQFPDSAFIERAARFSCFNGGNVIDMGNPFRIPESIALYSGGGGTTQEVFAGNGLKSLSGGLSQKNELSVGEASKDVSLSVGGSPLKNERKTQSLAGSHDEAKQGMDGSGNDSDEAEFSGGGDQDEPSGLEGAGGETFAKGLDSKKRKRNGQDYKHDLDKGDPRHSCESAKDNAEIQQKGDHNPTSTNNKSSGKHGKQGSQGSDLPKEDYIHVRARRGQATNSHSLAERVRREKISERMKFLQDLVPGCSKVTGKAVMLDEIINYVQSLQRQVEFLSMKLSTVNPRLDFNIEGLLAKDILQSRMATSSTLGFSPDMPMAYPSLHPSQQGLIQAGLPATGSSSDLLQRNISSHLTPMTGRLKEPTRVPKVWEDELHNVVQMSYGTTAPSSSQDPDGSLPHGHMKVEL